jgi:ACR3 family arsenite transporter
VKPSSKISGTSPDRCAADFANTFIFFNAYIAARLLKLPYNIAAPAGMIGASNFFELSVAVAIACLEPVPPRACYHCGVLTEVPVMLLL